VSVLFAYVAVEDGLTELSGKCDVASLDPFDDIPFLSTGRCCDILWHFSHTASLLVRYFASFISARSSPQVSARENTGDKL